MSKGKRKPTQGIMNSRLRDNQRLASVAHAREEPRFLGTSPIAEIKPVIELRISQGYTPDQLDQRRAEVSEGEKMLDSGVRLLFEQTRDGISTPTEYKNNLLLPNIASDNIVDAIELGMKAWAPILFSKEH